MSAFQVEAAPAEKAEPSRHPLLGRVFSNTGWNILGSAAPLVVAVVAIPILIGSLGNDRFSILTLAWTLIGYFGLFDLGLGRALTKIIAEKIRFDKEDEIPGAFWSCLVLLALFGAAGTLLVGVGSHWLAGSVLKIPAVLLPETIRAFWLIAFTIPIVSTASGLRGCLEAKQRFASVNMVRVLVGVLGFLGPLAVLPFSHKLYAVIGALCVVRLVTWVGFFRLCVQSWPAIWSQRSRGNTPLVPMLRYGGWVTVTNIVSPFMVYMDRFLISHFLSIGVVAFYVTPQEMITKLLVVPMALQTAVFPIFSGSLAAGDNDAKAIYRRAIDSIMLILFPICLAVIAGSREILALWLHDASFAAASFRVLIWLSLGVVINGVAHVPAAVLQGGNRPDICAKLHLIELPLYAVVCCLLIVKLGIEGAAIAWVLRVAFDAGMLLWFARKWVPGRPFEYRMVALGGAVLAGMMWLSYLNAALAIRAGVLVIFLVIFGAINFKQVSRQLALLRLKL